MSARNAVAGGAAGGAGAPSTAGTGAAAGAAPAAASTAGAAPRFTLPRVADAPWKVLSWAILIGLLAWWQWASTTGAVNPTILPAPTDIWAGFLLMLSDGTLANYVGVSLMRVFEGYLLGGGVGLVLGLILGLSRKLEAVANLFIGLLRPIPPIAWIPVLILAFGIGEESKVLVIAIGSFWSLLLNTIEGVRAADHKLIELSRVLVKDRRTVLTKIILPSAVPSIVTGARLGMSRAWGCVVTAEMIAASAGLGYLIQYARELSQPALMFVGVAMIGLIGLVIDAVMMAVQKKLTYWNTVGH